MLPSSVEQECKSNIFFRYKLLREKLKAKDDLESMAIIRKALDDY